MKFLHLFISFVILGGLKKGESSVLDYSENLMYILENLYLKMKIISQLQATVAASAEYVYNIIFEITIFILLL